MHLNTTHNKTHSGMCTDVLTGRCYNLSLIVMLVHEELCSLLHLYRHMWQHNIRQYCGVWYKHDKLRIIQKHVEIFIHRVSQWLCHSSFSWKASPGVLLNATVSRDKGHKALISITFYIFFSISLCAIVTTQNN